MIFILQQMEIKLTSLDFQIGINSFHDEIMCKMQLLTKMEIEFLRKFQFEVNLPETHPSMIFFLRNVISCVEQMYKDVRDYFTDLQIPFLYDFFRKIQLVMVSGYNFLSQALLININQVQYQKAYRAANKSGEAEGFIDKKKKFVQLDKNQCKKIEQYDFAINILENEEERLGEEIRQIQDKMLLQKGLIQKLKPSKAVKQLEEMKQQATISLEQTERIFEETYQLKYIEFKNYMNKLQRPEELTHDFCANLHESMREKFTKGMRHAILKYHNFLKLQALRKQCEMDVQTDPVEFAIKEKAKPLSKNQQKLQNLLIKQRKISQKLQLDVQRINKQLSFLRTEKHRLEESLAQSEAHLKDFKSSYDILSNMYDEKRQQNLILKQQIEQYGVSLQAMKIFETKMTVKAHTSQIAIQAVMIADCVDGYCQASAQSDNIVINMLRKNGDNLVFKIREKDKLLKTYESKESEIKLRKNRMRISQTVRTNIIAALPTRIKTQSNDQTLQYYSQRLQEGEEGSNSSFQFGEIGEDQILIDKIIEQQQSQEDKDKRKTTLSRFSQRGTYNELKDKKFINRCSSKLSATIGFQTDFSQANLREGEKRSVTIKVSKLSQEIQTDLLMNFGRNMNNTENLKMMNFNDAETLQNQSISGQSLRKIELKQQNNPYSFKLSVARNGSLFQQRIHTTDSSNHISIINEQKLSPPERVKKYKKKNITRPSQERQERILYQEKSKTASKFYPRQDSSGPNIDTIIEENPSFNKRAWFQQLNIGNLESQRSEMKKRTFISSNYLFNVKKPKEYSTKNEQNQDQESRTIEHESKNLIEKEKESNIERGQHLLSVDRIELNETKGNFSSNFLHQISYLIFAFGKDKLTSIIKNIPEDRLKQRKPSAQYSQRSHRK